MAISHALPLLLLFVSILFLPSTLGTAIEFSDCQHDMYEGVVNVTKVEIIPYPIKFHDNPIFKITAVTSQNLTTQSHTRRVLDMEFNRGDSVISSWRKSYDICDVTKCPIEPGPFVITLANIYAVQRNDHLSGEYNVSIYVYFYESDSAVPPSSLNMCASFKFHASALAEFTNSRITDGVSVSKVEIFPFNVTVNDNPIFRITADTPKNISSSSTVSARMVFEGSSELFPRSSRRSYKLCDSSYHCPIEPGLFVLTFPHPYWRYKMEAGRYLVEVQIVDQNFPFHASMNLIFRFQVSEA